MWRLNSWRLGTTDSAGSRHVSVLWKPRHRLRLPCHGWRYRRKRDSYGTVVNRNRSRMGLVSISVFPLMVSFVGALGRESNVVGL